jgi:hypothetical protein
VRLIADENAGIRVTAEGLGASVSTLRSWGYRTDYSVQFLGLLRGSVVGIVSSVVLFRSPSEARGSITYTASACSSSGAERFAREPATASDAYLCVTKVSAGSAALIVYRCEWSRGDERAGVSVNISIRPIRPPGITANEATALVLHLARIQIKRSQ